jgi:hypothetical protein
MNFTVTFFNHDNEKIMEFFGYLNENETLEDEIQKMLAKIPPFIKETIKKTTIKDKFS